MSASFPFGFEGVMRDLIVLIPGHCLSIYFIGEFICVNGCNIFPNGVLISSWRCSAQI